MTRAQRRGFTLIELMMVVAIVGILSSIAYPLTQRALLRTKASERTYMLRAVKQAVEESYRQYGSFPPQAFGPIVTGIANPAMPLSARKRPLDLTLAGWNLVTPYLVVEGEVYYSYTFIGREGGNPSLWLSAVGDLDDDKIATTKWLGYVRHQGVYLVPVDAGTCAAAGLPPPCEYPASGQEDESTFGSY